MSPMLPDVYFTIQAGKYLIAPLSQRGCAWMRDNTGSDTYYTECNPDVFANLIAQMQRDGLYVRVVAHGSA